MKHVTPEAGDRLISRHRIAGFWVAHTHEGVHNNVTMALGVTVVPLQPPDSCEVVTPPEIGDVYYLERKGSYRLNRTPYQVKTVKPSSSRDMDGKPDRPAYDMTLDQVEVVDEGVYR